MTQQAFTDEIVSVSELKPCPVCVTLHSEQKIERIGKSVSNNLNRYSIPAIDVATCNGIKYVADGGARVAAFKQKGYDKIKARIHSVNTIEEVVILHVKLNQTSPINPLRLYDVTQFLEKKGFQKRDLPKLLWLDNNHSRLVEKLPALEKKTIELFNRFLDELSLKYSTVVLPVYVVEAVAKVDAQNQEDVLKDIISLTCKTQVPENKFTFLSPDQLTVIVSQYKKENDREPAFFDLVSEGNPVANIETNKEGHDIKSKKTQSNKFPKPLKIVKGQKELDEAKSIIGGSPHKAILKAPESGEYLLDMKNHTMSKIIKNAQNITVEGVHSKPVFMIPPQHAEQLKLEVGDSVYFKTITTKKQLEKLVDKIDEHNILLLLVSSKPF